MGRRWCRVRVTEVAIPLLRYAFPMKLLLMFAAATTMLLADPVAPPVAKKEPKTLKAHNDTRVDEYFWMRYKENPEVLKYVNEENAYTDSVMKPIQPLVDTLFKETLGRWKQTDTAAPYRDGGFFYYSRTEEGKQYPIYGRKKGSVDASEELLLDVNEMAKGLKFLSVGRVSPSPDHKMFAYAKDVTGYREYSLHFRNLATGKDLPDVIERIGNAVWAEDGQTVLYSRQHPQTKRSFQVWLHTLGTPAAQDKMLFEEKREKYEVGLAKSSSNAFLFIEISSGQSSETRYVDAKTPNAAWKVLIPMKENITYNVEHHGDRFFVQINDTGRDYRVVSMPVSNTAASAWKEEIPAAKGLYIERMQSFANHMVYQLRLNGLHTLRVVDMKTGKSHDIKQDEQAYTLTIGTNAEYNTDILRFNYQSPITPESVFDYNMADRTRVLVKQTEVPNYDASKYTVERVTYTSSDGTKVPMTISYKKGLVKDGKAPLLLYGYGAYSIAMNPTFSIVRPSLLDRGVVYAVAHIRGGTELGRSWYEDGKLMKKKNTFRDFIAAAEYLIANKYTTSERLAIEGGSAGGLLVGACMTMRPELFKTVIAAVPFVDVVSSLQDKSIPLSATDADEFGDPDEQQYYEYLKSYSPYDRTVEAKYPNVYIFSGMNDSQVVYWEPLKWTAKLRAVNKSNSTILLKMNVDAGHGGASGRYDRLKETVISYGFMLHTLGIKQ